MCNGVIGVTVNIGLGQCWLRSPEQALYCLNDDTSLHPLTLTDNADHDIGATAGARVAAYSTDTALLLVWTHSLIVQK